MSCVHVVSNVEDIRAFEAESPLDSEAWDELWEIIDHPKPAMTVVGEDADMGLDDASEIASGIRYSIENGRFERAHWASWAIEWVSEYADLLDEGCK